MIDTGENLKSAAVCCLVFSYLNWLFPCYTIIAIDISENILDFGYEGVNYRKDCNQGRVVQRLIKLTQGLREF